MTNLPATMSAAVYRGRNDVRVETVEVPAIGPGEVLVQVTACGVCGTDLKKIHHGLQSAPRIYGHETVGRIAALGDGVDGWAVGERVAVYHHLPCGECQFCRRGVPSQCPGYKRTGVTAGFEPAGGGFAGYVRVMDWIVRGGGLVHVPDGVSDLAATWIEPVNTVCKGVQRSGLEAGDLAVVLGAGPIGLLLMQLARVHGCRTVVSDLLSGRLATAVRLGATATAGPDDVRLTALELTDGRGADAVFLAVPNGELIETALGMTRPGGTVVLFAHTHLGTRFTADAGEIGSLDKRVLGSYSSDVALNAAAEEAVFGGKIEVESLVSHVLPLTEIEQAIALASRPTDRTLKVVVTP